MPGTATAPAEFFQSHNKSRVYAYQDNDAGRGRLPGLAGAAGMGATSARQWQGGIVAAERIGRGCFGRTAGAGKTGRRQCARTGHALAERGPDRAQHAGHVYPDRSGAGRRQRQHPRPVGAGAREHDGRWREPELLWQRALVRVARRRAQQPVRRPDRPEFHHRRGCVAWQCRRWRWRQCAGRQQQLSHHRRR